MFRKTPSLIILVLLVSCAVQLIGAPIVTLVSGPGSLSSTSGVGTVASPMTVNSVVTGDTFLLFSVMAAQGTSTPLIMGGTGDPFLTTARFVFNFLNNTGQNIVGYFLELGLPNGFPSPQSDALQFVAGSASSPQFVGPPVYTTITSDTITFSGGAVAQAATATLTTNWSMNDPSKGEIHLRATPVFAQAQQGIPEPSTYAMIGIGAAGLLIARLRRKK